MEESLLKTHFLGRDGFRWWVGQIPPLNSESEKQLNGGGWGNRYPVRIMGYHPYSQDELPDEDLPWAHVILPPGVGTGSGAVGKTVKFQEGDVVIGFFLDGDNAQLPVIFGAFGKSQYQAINNEKLPFTSFSGWNKYIKKPDASVLKPNETNESNAASAPTPRSLSPQEAEKFNSPSIASAMGTKISLPCGQSGNEEILDKVQSAIEQHIFFLKNLKSQINMGTEFAKDWVRREIKYRTEQLTGMLSGFVGGILNGIYEKLIPLLNKALEKLYFTIKDTLTKKAAIKGIIEMISPIKEIQKALSCLVNNVIESMGKAITEILTSISDNVLEFVDCVANEFVGGITNHVFDKIIDGLTPLFNALKTTQGDILFELLPGFDFENDVLREVSDISGGSVVRGLSDMVICKKPSQEQKYGACEYKIGSGIVDKKRNVDIKKIVKNSNIAKAIAATPLGQTYDDIATVYGAFNIFTKNIQLPEFELDLGECYAGPRISNTPVKIDVVGGIGTGFEGIPIFGFIDPENNGASFIGVDIIDGGQDWEFPITVNITDGNGNDDTGFGANFEIIINDEGQIIYIGPQNTKTIGENYTYTGENDDTTIIIEDTIIINPGQKYEDPSTEITDNFGNKYTATIQDGSIIKASPINNPTVTELPIITVSSDTGSGAIIKPILTSQFNVAGEVAGEVAGKVAGEVQSVIDCIT